MIDNVRSNEVNAQGRQVGRKSPFDDVTNLSCSSFDVTLKDPRRKFSANEQYIELSNTEKLQLVIACKCSSGGVYHDRCFVVW